MSRLIKDMYRQTGMFEQGLFGLSRDQMRSGPGMLANAGWYNQHGEYLGHGDLSYRDLARIASELEPDEVFIVMAEADWRYPEDVERKGGPIGNKFYMELSTSYVARYCMAILVGGVILNVPGHRCPMENNGLRILQIEREHAESLLAAA